MMRCQYYIVDRKNSGVGVLDKAVKILACLEAGPHSLSELVAATGIARPTAHRLAVALEFHRMNLHLLLVRIVSLQFLAPLLAPLEMLLARARSSTAVKVTSGSVLPLLSAYLDFEIQFQPEQY
jgi:hypothetical protein